MTTLREFTKVMAFISAAIDKPIKEATIDAYHELLKDLPINLLQAAVKSVICKDEYPTIPTIGKIRTEAVELLLREKYLDTAEAWGKCLSAMHTHGCYGEAKAMESMPPCVARVAKSMGWVDMCMSENVSVLRGQFMKLYEGIKEREKDDLLLPGAISGIIAGGELKMIGKGVDDCDG